MTKEAARLSLTIPQRYELMTLVKNMGGMEMTDNEFAEHCSKALGHRVHGTTITTYREAFGVPQYKAPTQAELRAKLRELQRELALRPAPEKA